MHATNTLIIGGGQAGLALSHHLSAVSHEHVILERGRVGERWWNERWDSLRMLTPNWMTHLPNAPYRGPDPEGFMTATELASTLTSYAESISAPVHERTNVRRAAHDGRRFVVDTDDARFHADHLVIATGWCDEPAVPPMARKLAPGLHQVVPATYRNPTELPDGGVLVIGASATGVQLAGELREAGRDVTLAVGRHSRAPRRYRGMDLYWWLHAIGSLDRSIDTVDDVDAVRSEPSLQLVGQPDHATIDLVSLHARGVRLTGRLSSVDGTRVSFGCDLAATVAAADAHLARLLARIDRYVERTGMTREVLAPEPTVELGAIEPVESLDLCAEGITTVIWATGYRRPLPWLHLPIRDARGEIAQHRGVTPMPGAYVLGQRFQHFRTSNFVGGVGRDACFVADHIHRNSSRTGVPSPFAEEDQDR